MSKLKFFSFTFFIIYILSISTLTFSQIRVKAVGDIMLGSVTPRKILPLDSGKVFIRSIGSSLQGSDILLGNLEGSFFSEGMKPDKCSDSARAEKICYEFGMPEYLAPILKSLHFQALDMDNNHSQDYGIEGYLFTINKLKSLGIKPIPKKSHAELDVNGKKIIILPFGFSGGSNKIYDIQDAKRIVTSYKKQGNLVIVFFHGGAEGKDSYETPDSTESYLGENRGNEILFAHSVIDAGADLVLGSGPHVLRAFDLYKNKFIAYSLGNFLTYGNVSIFGRGGISAILSLNLNDKNGDFISGKIIPVRQYGRGIPKVDKKSRAIKIIKNLTSLDSPNSKLIFTDEGYFHKDFKLEPKIKTAQVLKLKPIKFDSNLQNISFHKQ